MTTDKNFLSVDPPDICFTFELNKQIWCSLRLSNKTDDHVGFKVKTTNPKMYCVRPNSGVLPPRSSSNVTVTMQAQREAPVGMQCRDKFLIQSILVDSSTNAKDITSDMFSSMSKYVVEESKLRVVFEDPKISTDFLYHRQSSSIQTNGDPSSSSSSTPLLADARMHYSNLKEERKLTDQQKDHDKLNQAAAAAVQEHPEQKQKRCSSFPVMVVVAIAVVGVLLAYLAKKQPVM